MNASRRDYLAAVGTAGATAATAGCFGFGRSRAAMIPEMTIQSKARDPHAVHVVVLDGDEVVLWRTREVPGAQYADGSLQRMSGGTWQVPLDDPRPYRVLARIDDASEWDTFEPGRVGDCVRVEYEVERDGSLTTEYAHAEC